MFAAEHAEEGNIFSSPPPQFQAARALPHGLIPGVTFCSNFFENLCHLRTSERFNFLRSACQSQSFTFRGALEESRPVLS